MTGARCVRCGMFWSFTHNNPDAFRFICSLCPICISKTHVVAR